MFLKRQFAIIAFRSTCHQHILNIQYINSHLYPLLNVFYEIYKNNSDIFLEKDTLNRL